MGVRIGRDLGLDDDCLRDLEAAAILHDIGKIGVPDAILRKPAKLTEAEYALSRSIPSYGWAVLRAVPGFERVSLFVLHHHEAFDGKGYPAGLRGDEIPIGSRIVAVMDSFDAMVSFQTVSEPAMRPSGGWRRTLANSSIRRDAEASSRWRGGASTVFDATGLVSRRLF